DCTRALELEPDAVTYTARGWVYLMTEAPKPALADFDEALHLDPKHGEAYLGRAYAQVLLGKPGEALRDAEEGLRCGPESPRLCYNAARVYAQLVGKVDEADTARPGPLAREHRAAYQDHALLLLPTPLLLLHLSHTSASCH